MIYRYHFFQNNDKMTYLIKPNYLIILLLFALGCSTAVKKRWNNFSAYYNTYYNAYQNFENGKRKIDDQKRQINPEQPLRIYPEPINTGKQDFEVAIEKGANILREFPESKWVDDALLLIGKSYFFMSQYFAADQKFKELYNTAEDKKLIPLAVFWSGRVMHEMDQFNVGIDYLVDELNNDEIDWQNDDQAKVEAIIGQLYTELELWESAASWLRTALDDMPANEHRARANFLYGQVLEKLNQPNNAFAAYQAVEKDHPFYNLVYQAQRKQAEMARKIGEHERAYEIFEKMSKDDKNFDIQSELRYEMAKTLQVMGKYEGAKELYYDVIHKSQTKPSTEVLAKSYYGIAEIYRHGLSNYKKAAAYYDSAATQRANQQRLPEDFEAQYLSQVFGDYRELANQAHLIDSLMWLGSLSDAKLDSVVEELKKQKLAEIQRQEKLRQQQANTAFVASGNRQQQQQAQERQVQQGSGSFLNYRDADLVRKARQEFMAIWGQRPLVDNWRRIEEARRIQAQQDTTANANNSLTDAGEFSQTRFVSINLDNVPFTKEQRMQRRDELARIHFKLGNLFFLSLNKPDSAEYHYKKVIQEYPKSEVTPKAMYSLSELYFVNEQTNQARAWADTLLSNYPNTTFAYRLRERFDIERVEANITNETVVDSAYQEYIEIQSAKPDMTTQEQARKYKIYAQNHPNSSYAPMALFDAVQEYMKTAKKDSVYHNNAQKWFSSKEKWNKKQQHLKAQKDSARTLLQDTTVTLNDEKRAFWQSVLDSSLTKPDFSEHFPYQGALWDSTRNTLSTLTQKYPNFNKIEQARLLQSELKVPEAIKQKSVATEPESAGQNMNSDSTSVVEQKIYSCEELGISPKVIGGLESFAQSIDYPPVMRSLSLSGELPYSVVINKEGLVEKVSFTGQQSNTRIEEVITVALQKSISFQPILKEGNPVKARCSIKVPIKL